MPTAAERFQQLPLPERVAMLSEAMADKSLPLMVRIRAAQEILDLAAARKPDASRGA